MAAFLMSLGWVGWLLTSITWTANYFLAKKNRRTDRLQKQIERYIDLAQKIEEDALDYWTKEDTKVYMMQLQLKLKRLSSIGLRISKIDKSFPPPAQEQYICFKRTITLEREEEIRPIHMSSERTKLIMVSSDQLQNHYITLIDAKP